MLDIDGDPNPPAPECVNWGPDGKPNAPTTADCVPLDLTMLPNDVPAPEACCIQDAMPPSIETQCEEDCGYAACTLAIAKLRDAALALPHPDSTGLKKTAEERARGDLFGFANMLEMPVFFAACAKEVDDANGELTEIPLGAGMSTDDLIGHINNATLTLQFALDESEPYVPNGGACDSTPNIPLIEEESNIGGVAATGAITMFAPNGGQSVALSNIAFELRELKKRDGTIDVILTTFEADASDTDHGPMSFIAPHVRLVDPVSAPLVDGTLTFPAGSLRMEVSSVIASDGELLFGGARSSGIYVNTGSAPATRTPDGGFAFVNAPFEAGGYVFVLNTEAGTGSPR